MAIHVIQSQSIEVLVQGVLQSITRPSKNPFAVLKAQHFIVPTPAIETWLTQKIAEQQGISANSQFHQRIRGFQWFAYQQVLDDKDKVRKANIPRLIMKWRIYQTLKNYIEPDESTLDAEHPLYSIIQRIYDSASELVDVTEKRLKKQSMLYWVSEQVSKLFSHYMIYRGYCVRNCTEACSCATNWLQIWGRDQEFNVEQQFFKTNTDVSAFNLEQAQNLERWQRWLWQHTFHDDYVEMQSIDHDFWQILDDTEKRSAALKKLPTQLIVFTLLDLPPSQLQFLRRLGQYLDVLILHYNPSQEYWADSVDPNWKKQYDLRMKERFIQQHPQANDHDIDQFFQDFTLNFNAEIRDSRHPLLTRFGKQARDHFSILSNLSSGDEGQWVDAFVDDFSPHLLGRLQSEILYLVEPEPSSYVIDPQDNSIQIHVCHSALRQLEVLKDQLIHWLAQNNAEHPCRPSDILILVPDLKQIEPLIRSIFPATAHHHAVFLPVKIAGVTQLDAQHAWRSVLGRIELVQGRFTVEDFADWLNLSASQRRYGLDVQRTQRLIDLLIQAGFKRGLDTAHLQRSLSPEDTDYRFSLKFALDRLALGVAIPEHAVFGDTLSYAQILSSDFELIGILVEIYQDFAQRSHWMIAHQLNRNISVEAWLNQLKQDIEEFEGYQVESLDVVKKIIKKQYTMLTLAYRNLKEEHSQQTLSDIYLPLPYLLNEIQNTLESQVDQALPTGHITFSQIGQIRPLPYKLMVMLNLDSGKFPTRDNHLPFDLMQLLRPQLGDRSRLEDDQGAFLDALLLAQENLWLFYNGFDVSDGEVREPSSVLQELIQHISLITQSTSAQHLDQNDSSEAIIQDADSALNRLVNVDGIEIPEKIQHLYQVHPLQPFDPNGFEKLEMHRFQDQWFQVAQQIRQTDLNVKRQTWVDADYLIEKEQITVLDAGQWIQNMSFPARLYLKTLGIENLTSEDIPAQNEPLVLDGLGRYAISDFLQKQQQILSEEYQSDVQLLQDQLPVGKVQHSAWQMSIAEQENLKARLSLYATEVTQTTQRQWRIQPDVVINIRVPKSTNQQLNQDWISLDASSARAKRRTQVWLEYLLWLSYLNLEDQASITLQRIAIFSDATIISTGVTSIQAQQYLQKWFKAYDQAQKQPLVLPAALLMQLAEKGKTLDWGEDENGVHALNNFNDVLKEWNADSARFMTAFSIEDNEATKYHRDWQFILQQQDATVLLKHACDHFAYDLYQPIYQYQFVGEE